MIDAELFVAGEHKLKIGGETTPYRTVSGSPKIDHGVSRRADMSHRVSRGKRASGRGEREGWVQTDGRPNAFRCVRSWCVRNVEVWPSHACTAGPCQFVEGIRNPSGVTNLNAIAGKLCGPDFTRRDWFSKPLKFYSVRTLSQVQSTEEPAPARRDSRRESTPPHPPTSRQ
jgi:hypothetical protein